ncbi:hypothetical protein [Streptomyces sp. NPDC020298]|uniref:hypothetical protein n=1 Tax=unclassified Streptomyces TaxID=2593676 RepID=UPI0034111EAE
MTADEFNALHPVGTPVIAYPGLRPDNPFIAAARAQRKARGHADPDCTDLYKRLETVTRTPAWTLCYGAPVVSVDGYPGGIALTHIDVITEGAPA